MTCFALTWRSEPSCNPLSSLLPLQASNMHNLTTLPLRLITLGSDYNLIRLIGYIIRINLVLDSG